MQQISAETSVLLPDGLIADCHIQSSDYNVKRTGKTDALHYSDGMFLTGGQESCTKCLPSLRYRQRRQSSSKSRFENTGTLFFQRISRKSVAVCAAILFQSNRCIGHCLRGIRPSVRRPIASRRDSSSALLKKAS